MDRVRSTSIYSWGDGVVRCERSIVDEDESAPEATRGPSSGVAAIKPGMRGAASASPGGETRRREMLVSISTRTILPFQVCSGLVARCRSAVLRFLCSRGELGQVVRQCHCNLLLLPVIAQEIEDV